MRDRRACWLRAAGAATPCPSPSSLVAPDADRRTWSDLSSPPRGKLWTWTSQEFLPKAPPYAGAETKETFVRWFVGYVELHEKLCVEGRLVGFDDRRLRSERKWSWLVLPFSTDDEGNEVMIYAFAPAGPAMEAGR